MHAAYRLCNSYTVKKIHVYVHIIIVYFVLYINLPNFLIPGHQPEPRIGTCCLSTMV